MTEKLTEKPTCFRKDYDVNDSACCSCPVSEECKPNPKKEEPPPSSTSAEGDVCKCGGRLFDYRSKGIKASACAACQTVYVSGGTITIQWLNRALDVLSRRIRSHNYEYGR